MSFRSLSDKEQRDLAREYIAETKINAQYAPEGDYSHIFGAPRLDEDGMIEWLKAQDKVDPHSIMESLAKKAATSGAKSMKHGTESRV